MRHVLKERLDAYGGLAYPTSCTAGIAWDALRRAMSEDGYYFSITELQVLLAAHNIHVDAYEFRDTGNVESAFARVETPWLAKLRDAEMVRIVRDSRNDCDGLHGGHFVRIWREDAWLVQQEWPIDDEDRADTDSHLSSDESSSEDESESTSKGDQETAARMAGAEEAAGGEQSHDGQNRDQHAEVNMADQDDLASNMGDDVTSARAAKEKPNCGVR